MTTAAAPETSTEEVRGALLAASAARRTADRAEAELLGLAVHLVDLHPVEVDTPVASWDPASLLADGDDEPLAGAGTPVVAEWAVEELGAAVDVSYRSALGLVADALELCFRLPRLWDLVAAGRLQAWKARRVARHTRDLSPAAVGFVDRHAAVPGARNRIPPNLAALVHEALVRCDPEDPEDPEVAEGREQAAMAHRGVAFDYHGETAATATLTATLDLMDAVDLDATIGDLASAMGRLGDTGDLGERRAHALGLLAHPQRVLDLFAGHLTDDAIASTATLYLHVSADDLAEGHGPGHGAGVGQVERLGAATLDLLRDWLTRTGRLTVRPVLDLNRTDALDRHDPPGWLRDLVTLRDGHCVFPGCPVDARVCDLDHIDAYRDPDHGGPPGQTSPANLAPLCRRHHRLKTHTGWHYRRLPDNADNADGTSYEWTNPHGLTYHTHPTPKR